MTDPLPIIEARLLQIERTLAEVEDRLRTLERRAAGAMPAVAADGAMAPPAAEASQPASPALGQGVEFTGTLALVGRTFMVFGGAYLLRALTESGRLPNGVGIALGLAYATAWLVLAERAAGRGRRGSAAFHGVTTVLIGPPLLWEAATRFGYLGPAASAAALGTFVGLALLVAWRHRLQSVAAAASLAGMATALALVVGTGHLPALTVFLILLGIATLWLGYDRDWYWLRWPAALAANLAVLGLTLRALRPAPLERPGTVITLQLLLVAAYLASIAARTLVRGRVVIPFEVTQTVAGLALGFGGAVAVAHATRTAEAALGLASVALGVGCYALAFAFVERRQASRPNFYFYATLALMLTLIGASVVLKGAALAALLAALAVATTWLAWRHGRLALSLHGAAYAAAASVASGVLAAAAVALTGTPGAPLPALTLATLGVLAAPLVCLGFDRPRSEGTPPSLAAIPRVLLAVVLVVGVGGAIVGHLAPALAGVPPDPGTLATIRTAVLSVSAVLLALATRVDRFVEVGWLLYPVLGIGAVKLLFEDFRYSRAGTLFIALAVFGAALIAAPRLARRAAAR